MKPLTRLLGCPRRVAPPAARLPNVAADSVTILEQIEDAIAHLDAVSTPAMSDLERKADGSVLARLSPRRLWVLRVLTAMAPIGILAATEAVLRVSGLFRPEPVRDTLGNRAQKTLSFPEWDASVRMPKPASTYRIFTLGGSTTMGFGVSRPYAVLLEERLRGRLPDRHWEVINGGRPGVGSGLALQALEEAYRFDPDLVMIGLGHNEFLEVVFLSPDGVMAAVAKAGRFCQQFSIVNAARCFLRPIVPDLKFRRRHQLLSRGKFPYIRSMRQYNSRLSYLGAKLHDMISGCHDRGVQIMFVPAVPNLLWPPGNSVHGPGYGANAAKWQRLFARTQSDVFRLISRTDALPSHTEEWSAAAGACKELIEIDDQYAHSHYLLGLVWLGMGQNEKAKRELLLGNQYDKRGDRSNSDVIQAVISVCRERRVPVVDVRNRFFSALPQELQRYRQSRSRTHLFLDHCHPSEEGHALLADALFEALCQPARTKTVRPEHKTNET